MENITYNHALEQFRGVLSQLDDRKGIRTIIANEAAVLSRYQLHFQYKNITQLSEETFRSFLYFENNQHWTGLFRHISSLTVDMSLLREALAILLDSSVPLAQRFDMASGKVKGLGKALMTAILLVSSPREYGVWNNTSEGALKKLGLWQDNVRGRTQGQQYESLNQLLKQLANDLGTDLWILDALMWGVVPEKRDVEPGDHKPPESKALVISQSVLEDVYHPELRVRLEQLSNAPLDTLIREAGVIFENYLRNKIDSNSSLHGVELVDDALKPGGKLIFSSYPAEQQGVQFLFRGAMQFIRNPPMHRLIDYPESMAHEFLRLIDALMILLDQATVD